MFSIAKLFYISFIQKRRGNSEPLNPILLVNLQIYKTSQKRLSYPLTLLNIQLQSESLHVYIRGQSWETVSDFQI